MRPNIVTEKDEGHKIINGKDKEYRRVSEKNK